MVAPPGSACLLVLVLWINNPDIEDLKGGFRSRLVWDQALVQRWQEGLGLRCVG